MIADICFCWGAAIIESALDGLLYDFFTSISCLSPLGNTSAI
jgi:hypothetical protein